MKTYEDSIREAAETYDALRIVEKPSICNVELRVMRDHIAYIYGKDADTVSADLKAMLK